MAHSEGLVGGHGGKRNEMKCEACGTIGPEGANFCGYCGAVLPKRCPICNAEVKRSERACHKCHFDTIETARLRTLTSDMVPEPVARKVLEKLNATVDAAALHSRVELLGEEDTGHEIASRVLSAKGAISGFSALAEVEALEYLGPSRFTELVLALGVDVTPVIPDLSQGTTQPRVPRPSASVTDLEFKYRLNLPVPDEKKEGIIVARACSRCSVYAPAFNKELGVWESQVKITGLVLDGENDDIAVSITMDERMRPYDWMQPLDTSAKQFQFPAKMQLNNSMIIKAQIKATGQNISLVSRDVPCQAGRVNSWPPYGARLHSQRNIQYVDASNPLGPPIVEILDATTYLTEACEFFIHRADIQSYEYKPAKSTRDLPAVSLEWRGVRREVPGGQLFNHYHVYRSQDPTLGDGSWANVSGPIQRTEWVDPNPPNGPLYYRVVPVHITTFGDYYEGPSGQEFRVEPKVSVFRSNPIRIWNGFHAFSVNDHVRKTRFADSAK